MSHRPSRTVTPILLLSGAALVLAAFELYGLAAAPSATDATPEPGPFAVERGEQLDITGPDGRVAQYVYNFDPATLPHPKTQLHVIDPETGTFLTAGPPDTTYQYNHHRGIFIGWRSLGHDGQTYDFWSNENGPRILHTSFDGSLADFADTQTLTSINHWVPAADASAIVVERRTYTFHEALMPGGIVMVDVRSTLTAPRGAVHLSGDAEHAGVQYRPAAAVAENGSASYLFPPSAGLDEASVEAVHAAGTLPWVGQTHTIEGRQYYVQILNHPDNPEATWSAYRPYGRFGAYPEARIPAGDSLTLEYRFLIKRGDAPRPSTAATYYQDYAGS